jgi:hypothetical protein
MPANRDHSAVNDDTPLPLALAAEIANERGILIDASAKSLRREATRDRLETYDLFGRQQTTLGDIKRMIKRCRDRPKAPGSTSPEKTTDGSSGTPDSPTSGLAALMESAKKLSGPSKRTLQKNTGRTSAEVIPLASRS